MTDKQKNTLFETMVSFILIVGTGLVMLAPQVSVIRKVSEYSVHIMLGMLGLSLIALLYNKSKIMFAGMACTAALCLLLKNASNDILKLPIANTQAKISIAHINLSNITYGFDKAQDLLVEENIDLISFQELTPDWNQLLSEVLSTSFPFSKSEVRIDPYGMAIYSKYPFSVADTFMCAGKPNLSITLKKDKKNFQIISSYLTPALDHKSIKEAAKQLKSIANIIGNAKCPIIALGEYNMVYWTNEIREFRTETNLINSRRGLSQGNLRVPYDHIFFSDSLECTNFKELKDNNQEYVGIVGTYQIKDVENQRPSRTKLSMRK